MDALDPVYAAAVRGFLVSASFLARRYPRTARRFVARAAALLAGDLDAFAAPAAAGDIGGS
jgi:hypothetical protein